MSFFSGWCHFIQINCNIFFGSSFSTNVYWFMIFFIWNFLFTRYFDLSDAFFLSVAFYSMFIDCCNIFFGSYFFIQNLLIYVMFLSPGCCLLHRHQWSWVIRLRPAHHGIWTSILRYGMVTVNVHLLPFSMICSKTRNTRNVLFILSLDFWDTNIFIKNILSLFFME